MSPDLGHGLVTWLDEVATDFDTGQADPASLLPRLAQEGLFGLGVPGAEGGAGGELTDAVEAVAAVSERSMAAGFVFWSQRTFIEYLLQSPNAALRARLLPGLVGGTVAGATGLSNAMKFLSGLEELQVTARPTGQDFRLDGKLPWVTNLQRGNFHVAAAVALPSGQPFIASLPHGLPGLDRSADLDLLGMRSSATAALALKDAPIGPEHVLHANAGQWLPQVRPAFLGLQCAMSIGLARRALAEATAQAGPARQVLHEPLAELGRQLAGQERALREGLRSGAFHAHAAALFRIRIALAEIAAEAVQLELQASGGRAYLMAHGQGFARRWREAAFVPVITPSLTQLKASLAGQAAAGRAA
jgi:alkylation response protein AidB-like acyl-CoA dehydrogenase